LDVKKRFSEEQIIGFLREAEAGVAVRNLCRKHGFSEASYYLWRMRCLRTFGVRAHEPRISTLTCFDVNIPLS
jgi:transposase-like protein